MQQSGGKSRAIAPNSRLRESQFWDRSRENGVVTPVVEFLLDLRSLRTVAGAVSPSSTCGKRGGAKPHGALRQWCRSSKLKLRRIDGPYPQRMPQASSCSVVSDLCCAKIPFSFEVDRYNGQPANNRLTFIYALLPEKEPPAIVGLETAVEMNLVQIGTNEFFPNSLFSILANHPLPRRKLNGFLFAMSTSRFGRDVWSCVPPCFKWTGIAQCSAGAEVIGFGNRGLDLAAYVARVGALCSQDRSSGLTRE